jgi:hypothetical protein
MQFWYASDCAVPRKDTDGFVHDRASAGVLTLIPTRRVNAIMMERNINPPVVKWNFESY